MPFLKRHKIPEEIENYINVICILDAVRVGRFKRLRELQDYIEKLDLEKKVPEFKWKTLKGDIESLLSLPGKSPSLRRFTSILPILNTLITLSFLIMIVLATLNTLSPKIITFNLHDVLMTIIFITGGLLVARWYMEEKIKEFYEESQKKKLRLGKINQMIIDKLLNVISEKKISIEKVRLKLFNIDYKGIIVLKKPSFFREHYLVKLNVKENIKG
jgi:ABC-type multidrug transport system fused ATPase/permease subunit